MSERSRLARAAPLALGAGAAAALTLRWLSSPPRPGAAYLAGAPLLMAHRGGSALAPENTLTAFDQAITWWGADILELDVHATRDGEVVVIHDATLERTTNGSGAVADHSLAEIQALDAGYHFTPDGGATHPYRGQGVVIPTLVQLLDALPDARVNVEIKDARAQERVWEVVHAADAVRRVLIAAGERANRGRFTAYSGAVSASAEELRAFYIAHRLHAASLFRPETDAFQMPERHKARQLVTPRFVHDAHARNVAVHVWTVDRADDMQRLLAMGVDGIITDRPDRLARVLHARYDRPLPPGPPMGDSPAFLERLLRA